MVNSNGRVEIYAKVAATSTEPSKSSTVTAYF
jgi:hypothetical protein